MSASEKLPSMPDSSEFSSVADLFKLLGDSSRLKIFWILCPEQDCFMVAPGQAKIDF